MCLRFYVRAPFTCVCLHARLRSFGFVEFHFTRSSSRVALQSDLCFGPLGVARFVLSSACNLRRTFVLASSTRRCHLVVLLGWTTRLNH
jgi:hypothetical protein